MRKCMECGKEYDDSKRIGDNWEKIFAEMGACANICNNCWREEYHQDISKLEVNK